jgi:chloride channel 3/4/5
LNLPPFPWPLAPQVYAVIGAASAVGGLTRMTVSLVVIISKFTADYFSTDGIYEGYFF